MNTLAWINLWPQEHITVCKSDRAPWILFGNFELIMQGAQAVTMRVTPTVMEGATIEHDLLRRVEVVPVRWRVGGRRDEHVSVGVKLRNWEVPWGVAAKILHSSLLTGPDLPKHSSHFHATYYNMHIIIGGAVRSTLAL